MITLKVSVSGEFRDLETRAEKLEDLAIPLKLWNQYKRKSVQRRFDEGGPGWPKRQDGSTGVGFEERVKQKADAILRTKLRAELRRAQRRHARGKGNESKSAASIKRRYAVLKEFERIAAGGEQRVGGTFEFKTGKTTLTDDAKLDKSVRGLRERYRRASVKASSRPLGRIAQSIKSKVEKSSVEIYSSIPWSGAHNEGAVVGHGAELPKRQFLDVTEEDLAVLAILIEMHVSSG